MKRYKTEIQADQMVMLTPKGVREQAPEYPEETADFPDKPEAAGESAKTDTELGDTLNLDEDVDFF